MDNVQMVPEKGTKKNKGLSYRREESPSKQKAGLIQPRAKEVGKETWKGWNLSLPVVYFTEPDAMLSALQVSSYLNFTITLWNGHCLLAVNR